MKEKDSYYRKHYTNVCQTEEIHLGLCKLKHRLNKTIWLMIQEALTEYIERELKACEEVKKE